MVIRMLGAAALVTVMSVTSGVALAEDGHELTTLKGEQGIDMKAFDHAMAGAVKDFVVWGSVDEASGSSELIMRRDGQNVKATFKKTGAVFGGVVSHENATGVRTTSIEFSGLDRQRNEYSFTVNGDVVKARVESEEFRNHHFIKPTYVITLADGSQVSFTFGGQACYNYSLHLITMMIAALSHG